MKWLLRKKNFLVLPLGGWLLPGTNANGKEADVEESGSLLAYVVSYTSVSVWVLLYKNFLDTNGLES